MVCDFSIEVVWVLLNFYGFFAAEVVKAFFLHLRKDRMKELTSSNQTTPNFRLPLQTRQGIKVGYSALFSSVITEAAFSKEK